MLTPLRVISTMPALWKVEPGEVSKDSIIIPISVSSVMMMCWRQEVTGHYLPVLPGDIYCWTTHVTTLMTINSGHMLPQQCRNITSWCRAINYNYNNAMYKQWCFNYVWCSREIMHIAKIIQCCFIVDSECNTISQNKTVDIIKIFQPELDLQHF